MVKVSVNQAVAKAVRLEQAGNFKKAAGAYGAILKSGNTNTAARNGYLRSLKRFTKQPPDKAVLQKQVASITKLIEVGDWVESIKQCSCLLKLFPDNVILLNMNGVALLGLGNAKKASEMLYMAVSLKPNFAAAHQNLGLALQQTGKPEAALRSFEKAIQFDPKFAKAHDNIGSMNQYFGNFKKAIEFHKKSLAIDPSSVESHRNLAIAYNSAKLYPQALSEYRTLIAYGEQSALTYIRTGVLLRRIGQPTEALKHIERALELDPLYVTAHVERGDCLRGISLKTEAEKSYRAALALEPKCVRAYYGLGSVCKFEKGGPEISTLQDLSDQESSSIEERSIVNFTLANAFEHFGEMEASFYHLSKGNSLKNSFLRYEIETDQKLFADIMKNGEKVVSFSADVRRKPLKFTPIFILGMPRSGTSLTEQIISAHSDVTGCGELNFASNYGMSIARGKSAISPKDIEVFRDAYIEAVSTLDPKTKFITDKMPQNFRIIGLLTSAFPEARIIHTKRDPSAVCWSNYSISFGSKGLGYSYNLDNVVQYYHLYETIVSYWKSVVPGQIYDLDYEKLTQRQEIETRNLIEFLNIGWEEACLFPENNSRSVNTASYSQVKRSVYKGSSQKWKRFKPYLNGAFDSLTR